MKDKIIFIICGVFFGISLMLFMSASWKPYSQRENEAVATSSLTCSSDGSVVYAADLKRIYKSSDFGETWTVVLERENND